MRRDFEIHVGFPIQDLEHGRKLKAAAPGTWVSLEADEVTHGTSCSGPDPHDVPGRLGIVTTTRFTAVTEAIQAADHMCGQLGSLPDTRIELEEVLCDWRYGEPRSHFVQADPYVPDSTHFPHGLLLPETPAFEAHYVIKSPNGSVPADTKTLVALAEEAGIPVDQGVSFDRATKVILTVFFSTWEQMRTESVAFADKLAPKLSSLGDNTQLKVVAERILLCLQPRSV